jgi:hypothetical protein
VHQPNGNVGRHNKSFAEQKTAGMPGALKDASKHKGTHPLRPKNMPMNLGE